jgi:hypothetical protein
MQHPERIFFEQLKREIAVLFRQNFPGAPVRMEEWSGKVLERFQDELLEKVKSTVSTKWYYTHIKGGNVQKLPRVDVLNLLSAYAGYESWEIFVTRKRDEGIGPGPEERNEEKQGVTESGTAPSKKTARRMPAFLLSSAGVIVILVLLMMFTHIADKKTHRFCFADADLEQPITREKIGITVLRDGESPWSTATDSSGCFSFTHAPGKVTFIVKAEYYHTDTVTRMLGDEPVQELIRLQPDDYARMISIFSGSKIEDYEKRKAQLEKMFADEAEIIQVDPGDERGMEMYNKQEFINKLTMPISSLKNIEVIETFYDRGRIVRLRFIQKNQVK